MVFNLELGTLLNHTIVTFTLLNAMLWCLVEIYTKIPQSVLVIELILLTWKYWPLVCVTDVLMYIVSIIAWLATELMKHYHAKASACWTISCLRAYRMIACSLSLHEYWSNHKKVHCTTYTIPHLQFGQPAGQSTCWCHDQWVSKELASLDSNTVKESCSI